MARPSEKAPVAEAELTVERDQNITIVTIEVPQVEEECHVESLSRRLTELANTADPPFLVLDFSAVRFFTAQMLGVLVAMNHRLEQRRGRLALAAVREPIRDMLVVTRLDRVLPCHADRAAAQQALRR